MHTTVLHELWLVESMDVETWKWRWANGKVVCRFLTVWALLLITSVLFKGQLQCYLTGLQLLIFVITYYSGIYPSLDFVQFSSVTQVWLCDPMDCSTSGFPVHQLPELTQTHVHWVGDAIQPSCPLLLPSIFPSIRVFPNESVLLIRWPSIKASASASVLPLDIQNWFPLGLTGLNFLLSKWLSIVFSETTIQKHQFFGAQLSFWSNSHIHTLLLENIYFCKQCQNNLLTGENEIPPHTHFLLR